MTPVECPFESDLVDAIRSSRWPARADAALVAHVDTCAICRDVAAVAPAIFGAVDADAMSEMALPVLPDARVVWLRAQWRARAEAERRATRSITATQAAAIAMGAAFSGAVFGATSGWLQRGLVAAASTMVAATPSPSTVNVVMAALSAHAVMATALLLMMLAAPVAAYVVTRE